MSNTANLLVKLVNVSTKGSVAILMVIFPVLYTVGYNKAWFFLVYYICRVNAVVGS